LLAIENLLRFPPGSKPANLLDFASAWLFVGHCRNNRENACLQGVIYVQWAIGHVPGLEIRAGYAILGAGIIHLVGRSSCFENVRSETQAMNLLRQIRFGAIAIALIATTCVATDRAEAAQMSSGACCAQPCINYLHLGRPCYCCQPPVQTTLAVKDPCTCCDVCVPVCLPACCTGAPCVSCRHGLLARGIVTYDWSCGVSVTVRFKLNGELLVTYRGA
jgi:hypothetical protein